MAGEGNKNVLVSVLVLAAVLAGGYFLLGQVHKVDDGVFCTQEAKLCPDGSYVGRSGPLCEFAACPDMPDTSGWRSTTSGGITFKYPEKLPAEFITAVDWPPQVQVITGDFECTDAGEEGAQAGKTGTKVINGHEYCVTVVAEGAAGSIYKQYAYAARNENATLYFTFTLREVQCANYDEPKKTACEEERAKFNIDLILDLIIESASKK